MKLKNVSLPLLMDASNMFGHGMGKTELNLSWMNIRISLTMASARRESGEMVVDIDGFAEKRRRICEKYSCIQAIHS